MTTMGGGGEEWILASQDVSVDVIMGQADGVTINSMCVSHLLHQPGCWSVAIGYGY